MTLTSDSRAPWHIYCCVAFTSCRSFKSHEYTSPENYSVRLSRSGIARTSNDRFPNNRISWPSTGFITLFVAWSLLPVDLIE